MADVDPRVRERLTAERIQLDRYGVDELADILQPRAIQGLPSQAVERSELKLIADRVAGVARAGIQTLRCSAEVAHERGVSPIADACIDAGHERAQREIREQNLASLPFHHHLIYELIREAGTITTEELWKRYDEIAEDVYQGRPVEQISRRWRSKKRQKLERYDLIESDGAHRFAENSVCDERIESPLNIDVG